MPQHNTAVAASLAVVLVFGSAVAAAPAPAALDPHVIVSTDPATVDDPDALRELYRVRPNKTQDPTEAARCGKPSRAPVPDGEPIVVTVPPAPPFTVGQIPATSWRNPPVTDPAWLLTYLGLRWMMPLARRAAQDGQQRSLAALVDQTVQFHRENPDPDNNLHGWDEGTALRRLATENCLYALTRSPALIPGMRADARVLLGSRYYGPPYNRVHNHGLMANLQLVRAAELLNRPSWRARAVKRMANEAPHAFTRIGTTWEQSSTYHEVNAILWGEAAVVLEKTPGVAARLRRKVRAAWSVFAWMTEPDGAIVQIGNSDRTKGQARSNRTVRVMRDDHAGWVIGRWSWTDPATSYYTLRYGPARRAHGHHDRAGGVTWSTRGVRVLVGVGRYTSDVRDRYHPYQLDPQGQNVAIPDGGKAGRGTGAIASARLGTATHTWRVRDTMFGIAHVRGVTVNQDRPSMTVSDTFPRASRWRQHWHLDPKWVLVSGGAGGTRLEFTHPSGHRLTVTTTGRVSSVAYGQTRPPMGWHFPRFGERVRAAEIVIRSHGRANRTTFAVTGP